MQNSDLIEAGKIINTHGIAGEVKIEVWLDSPAFFKKFKTIYIGGSAVEVTSAREHKGFIIAKLRGTDDINAAMTLKEKTVYISREDAHLPEGGYFIRDMIGADVVDELGNSIGKLTETFETPANIIYVVKGESEHLIPAVPEFILAADVKEKKLTVRLIDGM